MNSLLCCGRIVHVGVHRRSNYHRLAHGCEGSGKCIVSDTVSHAFAVPTSDSAAFIRAALAGLEAIYKPDTPYAKAGIMLFDLSSRRGRQFSLLSLDSAEHDKRREALMTSLDRINAHVGRGAVRWGAQGPEHAPWHMQQEHLSPKSTTDWNELAAALCMDRAVQE